MRSLILASLAVLSCSWGAGPARAADDPKYDAKFVLWLAYTQETLPQVPVQILNLTQRVRGTPGWLSPLASYIFRHDDILRAYLTRVEKTRQRYGVLNPFDLELLGLMKRHLLESKEELLARFDRLTGELRIERRPAAASGWTEAVSSAAGGPAAPAPKAGARRWEPGCGCDVVFDGQDWKPAAGAASGSRQ
ncbi:MAG: hypothetical protein PHU21_12015 [Elusimicrobia bacterium]|nr:hypothetical protein [Elusimicrobiota bacterium]